MVRKILCARAAGTQNLTHHHEKVSLASQIRKDLFVKICFTLLTEKLAVRLAVLLVSHGLDRAMQTACNLEFRGVRRPS